MLFRSGSIKQTDGRHSRARGVRLCGSYQVAQRRVQTLPEGLQGFRIDFGAVSLWSAFKRADIVADGSYCVHDILHRLQDTRRRVRPTGGEEAVDGGYKGGDMDINKSAISCYRQAIVDFGRLQEELRCR